MGIESLGASIASVATAPVSMPSVGLFVNEGPVSMSILESPMTQSILEPASIITSPKQIIGDVWIPSQVPEVFESAFAGVNLDPNLIGIDPEIGKSPTPLVLDFLQTAPLRVVAEPGVLEQPAIFPVIQSEPETELIQRADTRLAVASGVQTTSIPAVAEANATVQTAPQALEEEVEEVVLEEEKEKGLKEEESEELEVYGFKYVEDAEVLEQRKKEIEIAVGKAAEVAAQTGVELTGELVDRFLTSEYEGVRSQIIKKTGPDGSYADTREAVRTDKRKFKDPSSAAKALIETIVRFKPVKKTKLEDQSKTVTVVDIARVLKYWIYKGVSPAQKIIERRVVKRKKAGTHIIEESQKKSTERTLANYPQLAEVFGLGLTTFSLHERS